MKRLGFAAVLLSLALSVASPARSTDTRDHRWFYEACGTYNCLTLSLTDVSTHADGVVWAAGGLAKWTGFGEIVGIPVLGGAFSHIFMGAVGESYAAMASDVYLNEQTETVKDWMYAFVPGTPPPIAWTEMLYGPVGQPYGYDHATEFVTLYLASVAVTEPATALLLATSLIGLAGVTARRRRRVSA